MRKQVPSEHRAFISGCLRRVRAGHLTDAFILADYLDDHALTHASPLRKLLRRFEGRADWWCKADMEKSSLRKWTRWELLALECRTARRQILSLFGRRQVLEPVRPELMKLWRLNRHLFDMPELRKESQP